MKWWRPPSFATRSSPGRRYKWYVLARIKLAPTSWSCLGVKALTVACVPTGAKTGVGRSPWGVWNIPALAWLSVAWIWKENIGILSALHDHTTLFNSTTADYNLDYPRYEKQGSSYPYKQYPEYLEANIIPACRFLAFQPVKPAVI